MNSLYSPCYSCRQCASNVCGPQHPISWRPYGHKTKAASAMEPHDRMRARDVTKVTKGEQAPSPPQQSPPVSRAPPPSSTNPKVVNKSDASQALSKVETASSQMRRCYDSYFDYHKCVKEKGSEAEECKKVADYYKSTCPDWVNQWTIKEN